MFFTHFDQLKLQHKEEFIQKYSDYYHLLQSECRGLLTVLTFEQNFIKNKNQCEEERAAPQQPADWGPGSDPAD